VTRFIGSRWVGLWLAPLLGPHECGHYELFRHPLTPQPVSTERTRIVGELELSQAAQQWVNVVLIWVGFGTLAGLLAKSLIPGREPSGAVPTVLIGVVGSVVGPLLLCHVLEPVDFNPISPLGFLASVGGAVAALLVYRLLVGLVFVEEEEDEQEQRS
jgi:uncharacterized membrane protein YeaQ/YmgE (transglycosylase-associated protein family)